MITGTLSISKPSLGQREVVEFSIMNSSIVIKLISRPIVLDLINMKIIGDLIVEFFWFSG